MRLSRRYALLAMVTGLAVAGAACRSCWDKSPAGGPATIQLRMEVGGGFKYVYSPADHELAIAFLKSTTGACTVTQLGVELTVKDGDIVVPATAPADKTFDPGGAVMTFGGANRTEPLNVVRGGQPAAPFHPDSPERETSWQDLKWVPSPGSFYPNSALNPNWPSMVDGRVVLTQGTLVGARPSSDAAINGLFEFRRASDGTTFRQAITDRTVYTTGFPGDRVVINLANARSGITRIEVKPIAGRPVTLMLMGKHDATSAPAIHVGDTVTHYCAFYELMLPVPAMSERLLPVFIGDPTKPLGGQPDPGAYCSGEFD